MLTNGFRGFPEPLQALARLVYQVVPRPLRRTFFTPVVACHATTRFQTVCVTHIIR
jgi:hypothetical protein